MVRNVSIILLAVLFVIGLCLSSGGMVRAEEPNGISAAETAVMIELFDPPTVQVYAREKQAYTDHAPSVAEAQAVSAAQVHLAQIERSHQDLLPTLEGPGINAKVLYRVQRVYNGVAVLVDASKLEAIRRLPGVKAVHKLIPKQVTRAASVPLIGAPALWNSLGLNATGEELRIGIIDTGIDYLHTDFGGPGTGYANNDPTRIDDIPNFPGSKVVGGYDFVGDAYDGDNSDPARRVPHPDPDPMDCYGHGTHVAGIAGGFGVNTDGTTYTGPYGPGTSFSSLKIGPGVAPKAKLYALKVFGCTGSTYMAAQAIEWAVDPNGDGNFADHLDVINLSIGTAYGGLIDDPDDAASENATLAGVIVVWAAGNDGDAFFVTACHHVRSLCTAASINSQFVFDGFRVNAPALIGGVYVSSNSSNYAWEGMTSPVTGPLAYPSSQSSGCDAFNPANAGLIAGKAALLDWTDNACKSGTRTNNAADAGAVGVVFAYNHEILETFGTIAGSDRIPATITTQAVGDLLKANLSSGVSVTLSKEWKNSQKIVNPALTDTLPDFTSRGPQRGNVLLKPDITGPGHTIFSAKAGTGADGVPEQGTSMAAPHVTGAMALLRQIHPDWSVEELKALAMNTATHDLFTGLNSTPPRYAPPRIGAGRIDLQNAAASDVVAFCTDDPGAVSVSFGAIEVVGNLTRTKTVRVVNKGSSPKTFTLAYDGITDIPGVSFSFPGGTLLTVPGGGSVTFQMQINATAAQMKHTHDPTVSETMAGYPRHWLSEKSGYITLTSGSGPVLRVPVYAAARPASDMGTSQNQIVMDAPAGTVNLIPSGQDVNTGTSYPIDEISLVSPLELQYINPDEPSSPGSRNGADLRYVGVTSDYKTRVTKGQGIADTVVQFGLATHGDWSSSNENRYYILVDSNRDGIDEYEVWNGWVSGGYDVFGIWAYPLLDGSSKFQFYLNGYSAASYNTVPFNTNVMVLPVKASDIGLSDANTRFNYHVETYFLDELIDKSDVLTYDIARPGLHLSGNLLGPFIYNDTNGNTIPVEYNREDYLANGSKGLLLLHHHNGKGNRAQVVAVIDSIGPETVSAPDKPSGPANGLAGTSYSYVTAGSTSSLGHPIEYQFDWEGDGSDLSSWGPSTQSKTWTAAGTYNVRARARCSQDTSIVSDWSAGLTVNITSAPVDKPNLTPYKPTGWSDKIVVSKTKGSETDSSTFYTTDTLYISWSVINNGKVAVSKPFVTQLYADGLLKKEWTTNSLDVNQHIDITDFSIGTLQAGGHLIEIATDFNGDVDESDEYDNVYDKTITVEEQPGEMPNLAPYKPKGWSDAIVVSKTRGSKTDSSALATTDTLFVSFALINNGKVPTAARFYTELYVDDEMKGSWYTDPPLKPGDSYTVTDVSIGSLDEGDHEISLSIDVYDDIRESDEEDNVYVKEVTVNLAGPDLTGEWVSVVQNCKNTKKGKSCKITGGLRVMNIGNRDVLTSDVEVYLEGDQDQEDVLIKGFATGKIKANGSKLFKLSYTLPLGDDASGKAFFAVLDQDDAIEELDEDNNLVVFTIP